MVSAAKIIVDLAPRSEVKIAVLEIISVLGSVTLSPSVEVFHLHSPSRKPEDKFGLFLLRC